MEKKHKKKIHPFWALFNLALATTAVLFWDTPMSVCGGLIMMFTFDKMIYYVAVDEKAERAVSKSYLKQIIKEETKKVVEEHKSKVEEDNNSLSATTIPYMVTSSWMARFNDYMPMYEGRFNFTEKEKELIQELSHVHGMKLDNPGFPIDSHDIYFEPSQVYVSDYDYHRFKTDRLTLREVMYFMEDRIKKSFDDEVGDDFPGNNEDYHIRTNIRGLIFTREHWKLFKKLLGQEKEIPRSKRDIKKEIEFQNMLKRQVLTFEQ